MGMLCFETSKINIYELILFIILKVVTVDRSILVKIVPLST